MRLIGVEHIDREQGRRAAAVESARSGDERERAPRGHASRGSRTVELQSAPGDGRRRIGHVENVEPLAVDAVEEIAGRRHLA